MSSKVYQNIALTVSLLVLPISYAVSQSNMYEKHIMVTLRMIGHQILLLSGDSSSRVLPIKNVQNQYKIDFASDFRFNPGKVSTIIDSLMVQSNIASHYITEIIDCKTQQVVYSYEINNKEASSLVPCKDRLQPIGCYFITISLLELAPPVASIDFKAKSNPPIKSTLENKGSKKITTLVLIAFPLFLLLGLFVVLRKKNQIIEPNVDFDLIQLGDYRFDPKNMKLMRHDQKVELTAKEAGLLSLLYHNINSTIKREVLLKEVWDDEGDYVGRTLDVYISKLRKKLEDDDKLKIMNIRGVGYKLILNM